MEQLISKMFHPRKTTQPELAEVIPPRAGSGVLAGIETFLSALGGRYACSLEIAGDASSLRFLLRAETQAQRQHLWNHLGAALPQAELRLLDTLQRPFLDPTRVGVDEQLATCQFTLRGPVYLPLRSFPEGEHPGPPGPVGDPLLGLLRGIGSLPPGWRGISRLVLRPLPPDWSRPYLPLVTPHREVAERQAAATTSSAEMAAIVGLLFEGTIALQAYQWYAARDWPHLGLLLSGNLAGFLVCAWLLVRRTPTPPPDSRLIQDKISRPACATALELAVIAPRGVSRPEVRQRLEGLAAAYTPFDLPLGNGLRAASYRHADGDYRSSLHTPWPRCRMVLTTREIASLWHLPADEEGISLVERTAARRLLPLPESVARGCTIGTAAHQGRAVPVALSPEVLRRNLLLVAKTGRGKSSLLIQLARYLMQTADSHRGPPALFLLDPHQDLAWALLGLVPPERQEQVVYLDLTQQERPFGLNLLDTGLGWKRDQAVTNTLTIFQREFDRFWGPRMEDAFRFALLTLFEANLTLCHTLPQGRYRQHTVLDIAPLLADPAFRRTVLPLVSDPTVHAWWSGYYDALDRRLQMEVANPVLTKIQRYAGSRAARALVGQPASTIDPQSWLETGAIVIVNTGKGVVGEDTAGLIGATLLNLMGLQVAAQSGLRPAQRRRVTFVVDEFHTLPGADFEVVLSELAKYGANLVLATQSLARLEALDREQHRALRAMVFANIDGLLVFNTSAEDARYLVPELGGCLEIADLVGLGEHQCYARLSARGEQLPVFSVNLDPPPDSDAALAAALARASSQRFGRAATKVHQDLLRALDRINAAHRAMQKESRPGRRDGGVPQDFFGSGPPLGEGTVIPSPQVTPRGLRRRHGPAAAHVQAPMWWSVVSPELDKEEGETDHG